MASRTPAESPQHDQPIRLMVVEFRMRGYQNIKADLESYPRPTSIVDGYGNAHLPDVTCDQPDGTRIILEAVTCSTIHEEHTAAQGRAFARVPGESHLAVPARCGADSGRDKVQRRLDLLGITAPKIWTPL